MAYQAPDVVITGVGVVSPIGIGYEALARAMAEGHSGVRPLKLFDTAEFPIRIGAEILDFDAKQYVTPRKSLKVMSRGIQLAFAAAQMSVQDANLTAAGLEPDRFGVTFGADMIHADAEELVEAFRGCIIDRKFQFARWGEQAIAEMYPLWMLKYLPNMPACHMAISLDARGPNNTVVLSEISSLTAIAEGTHIIERGTADAMIVGGTGSRIHPMSWAFRDNALHSPRHDHPESISRPFDANRDGMVYGEGSATFVLETRAHAEARGAKILARVAGFASAFEPCTPGEPFEGTAIRASIKNCLRSADMTATDIGHVNAHGLSTIDHDRVEASAIHDLLNDVPVTAPKSFFGNLGAGTGAVEMVFSLVALETGYVPITLNYEHPDPQCPVQVVHGQPQKAARRTAMLLNQTSMGQAVAMILAAE